MESDSGISVKTNEEEADIGVEIGGVEAFGGVIKGGGAGGSQGCLVLNTIM